MKLIHASGFDETEREGFRVIVYSNIMLVMQILFEVVEQLNIPLQHISNEVKIFCFLGSYHTLILFF
jgi:guanine nucleotide-binding protein subunit alpha